MLTHVTPAPGLASYSFFTFIGDGNVLAKLNATAHSEDGVGFLVGVVVIACTLTTTNKPGM
jgi:hypothetical protein